MTSSHTLALMVTSRSVTASTPCCLARMALSNASRPLERRGKCAYRVHDVDTVGELCVPGTLCLYGQQMKR